MKDTIYIKINHEMLVWARESLSITKTRAAEMLDLPFNRLNLLEQGERQPTLEELKKFSKTYKRTIATLLLKSPPKEKPIPPDRRTIESKGVSFFNERTILAVRKARALAESFVELRKELAMEVPKLTISATIKDKPQAVATEIRRILAIDEVRGIGNINIALDSYIEKIESLGIAVFQLALTQDNLRGFSITDDVIPIIGIKRGGEPPTAKVFTLFHELGHILLNEGGLCDLSEKTTIEIEKWCNSFSAEVLIPEEHLLKTSVVREKTLNEQKTWLRKELIELGTYFHVGPLTILRRLLDSNLTSRNFYNQKHEAWNKPQFGRSKAPEGRNIAKETIKEKGRTYISLAFSAFDKNRIDLKGLSDFLGIKFSYIQKTRQLLNA